MEFTKENVIKLLTDAQDLMSKTSKEHATKSEEFAKHKGICDWYEGKAQAYSSCSAYLGDIINWIKDYMTTTEDLIDKENR